MKPGSRHDQFARPILGPEASIEKASEPFSREVSGVTGSSRNALASQASRNRDEDRNTHSKRVSRGGFARLQLAKPEVGRAEAPDSIGLQQRAFRVSRTTRHLKA